MFSCPACGNTFIFWRTTGSSVLTNVDTTLNHHSHKVFINFKCSNTLKKTKQTNLSIVLCCMMGNIAVFVTDSRISGFSCSNSKFYHNHFTICVSWNSLNNNNLPSPRNKMMFFVRWSRGWSFRAASSVALAWASQYAGSLSSSYSAAPRRHTNTHVHAHTKTQNDSEMGVWRAWMDMSWSQRCSRWRIRYVCDIDC